MSDSFNKNWFIVPYHIRKLPGMTLALLDFYETILPNQTFLRFIGAEGEELLAPAEQVWDLDSLRFPVEKDFDWANLESQLEGPFFKDKKETFIQTVDPSGIELWFEK